jgi:DNA-binding phage protein
MRKDRNHDDAMAELLNSDPALAAALLHDIEMDGDQAELTVIHRQLAKAAKLSLKKPDEKR